MIVIYGYGILNKKGGATMKDLFVERWHRSTTMVTKSHFHDFYEIYYLCDGNMRYIINDEFFEVEQNDVVLVPRGVIHNTSYGEDETNRLLINFSERYVSDPDLLSVFRRKVIKLSRRDGFELEAIFKKIEAEYTGGDRHSALLISQYITELLIIFSRSEVKNEEKALDGYSQIMQDAVKYINTAYASNISLADLSLKFGMSKSFFSRKFKQITGFGLSEYITLVRIKNAERLLLEGRLSVTEVAFACGFNDCSYFSATFKRIMGVTPHKFSESAT